MTSEPHDHDDTADEGQVSEVSGMEASGAGQPVMPDQAVAGAPEAESGRADEGAAGPNARPRDNRPDRDDPDEPGDSDSRQ